MNYTDIVNGLWEIAGGFFILPSIINILKEKEVKGINWLTPTFFLCWGLWNIYFYPHNNLIFSFYGGIFLAIMNLIWVVLLIKYYKKTKL